MDPSKSFDDSWRSKNGCILKENWHFASKMVKKVRKVGFCNVCTKSCGLFSRLIWRFRSGGSEFLDPSPDQA